MNANLPSHAPDVKEESTQVDFFPSNHSSQGLILEMVNSVSAVCENVDSISWRERERMAALAIDAVALLIRNDYCLCLTCLFEYAERSRFQALCLRFEVKRQTGRSALKIPHRSNVREIEAQERDA